MSKLSLNFSVFLCGAVLMSFELVGSRVMAPWLGTSLYVWTSIIGVILASLSFGYSAGGTVADKGASTGGLAFIILCAAASIALAVIIQISLLPAIAMAGMDLRVAAFSASLIVFALPAFLLGMVSPYAVKLNLLDLSSSGTTVGQVSAISTFGSLFGTFITGYFLIAVIGTVMLQTLLAGVLLAVALCLKGFKGSRTFYVLFVLTLIAVGASAALPGYYKKKGIHDFDTAYSRVLIRDGKKTFETPKGPEVHPVRVLQTDLTGYQSMINPENPDELIYAIAENFHLAEHFRPNVTRALTIGGSAYVQPRDFLKRNPQASIDVVEIDPGVTELARRFFGLKDDPRLKIFHEDGRTFLNRKVGPYEVIFLDAFGASLTVPWQLTTVEVVKRIALALDEDGVVVVNLISALSGPNSSFARSLCRTFKEVFPATIFFQGGYGIPPESIQNFTLVAKKGENRPTVPPQTPEMASLLSRKIEVKDCDESLILRDDYAPVENMMLPATLAAYNGVDKTLF